MYFEGEHIKFVKQEMPALKSDFLMNIATSCMHNLLLAGFLVLTNNLTIYYSACRRRGGVLKCPRFCFFLFFTLPAVGEAES